MKRLNELLAESNIADTVQSYYNGKQLLFEISEPGEQPDVIYLDINMPEMNGIEVAKTLRERGYNGEIIFLTNDPAKWKYAFDVQAYNYIVKTDCSEGRFKSIFKAVVERVLSKNEERLMLSCCGNLASVPINKIRYFEVVNRVITVYYGSESFEFYSTLTKIEEQLSDYGFLRVHRSYLVPIAFIDSATYTNVVLRDGEQIPIGRAYQKNIKKLLEEKNISNL